jgi:hypothetical protein
VILGVVESTPFSMAMPPDDNREPHGAEGARERAAF